MPAYIKKTQTEVLSQSLNKIVNQTPLTAIGPGSIVRALAEAMSTEIGDIYDIMDFNTNQMLLSTATGSALDALGSLYDVSRKTISEAEVIGKKLGSFAFFIDSPISSDIVIPSGTNIYTDTSSSIGRRFSYSTTDSTTIPAGRTKAYASIKPNFADSVFTAGLNTLILHDFVSPPQVVVKCTNSKIISPQVAYEDDDSYRVRIIKKIRVTSGGTMESVRYAGLSVSGVRDISIKQAPYGMGSFEAIVTPDSSSSNSPQILSAAISAMSNSSPLGVRMFIKTPETLVTDIEVSIIMPGAGSAVVVENTTQRVKIGLTRYLNSMLPGSTLVYNRLLQTIMDASDLIKDVILTKYSVNGQELLRKNFVPRYDQMLVPGNIIVSIANS